MLSKHVIDFSCDITIAMFYGYRFNALLFTRPHTGPDESVDPPYGPDQSGRHHILRPRRLVAQPCNSFAMSRLGLPPRMFTFMTRLRKPTCLPECTYLRLKLPIVDDGNYHSHFLSVPVLQPNLSNDLAGAWAS